MTAMTISDTGAAPAVVAAGETTVLQWSHPEWPDLKGAAIAFHCEKSSILEPGKVKQTKDGQIVSVEIAAFQTAAIHSVGCGYVIDAIVDGQPVRLARGIVQRSN